MYTKSNKISVSQEDLSNYIEGYDIYNSALVGLLRDWEEEKIPYLIKTKSYRPDLIAKDLYGDVKWMGLLMLTAGIGLEDYVKGTILMVYPKAILDRLLRAI